MNDKKENHIKNESEIEQDIITGVVYIRRMFFLHLCYSSVNIVQFSIAYCVCVRYQLYIQYTCISYHGGYACT